MKINKSELFNKYFPNKIENLNKAQLKNMCFKLVDILEKDGEEDDQKVALFSDETELEYLEMSFLYLYLQMCNQAQDRLSQQEYSLIEDPMGDTFPCDVYYSSKDEVMLVDTPVQLGSYRTYGEKNQQHLIASLVSLAIENYASKNDIEPFGLVRAPYCIYLIRRCKRDDSSNTIPDIDNVGARHIINIIARYFALSDSFSSLSWNCNTVEYVDDEEGDNGTSILIVSEDKKIEFESKFIQKNHSLNWLRV